MKYTSVVLHAWKSLNILRENYKQYFVIVEMIFLISIARFDNILVIPTWKRMFMWIRFSSFNTAYLPYLLF